MTMHVRAGAVLAVVMSAAVGFTDTQTMAAAQSHDAATVTYASDIAPILDENCVVCHRPDAIGPFSLATYGDARRRSELIAGVATERSMPPWKPVPGYGRFQNERRLTAVQIERLQRWAATDATEGDAANRPLPPVFDDDWQLGEPDLIVTMDTAYVLDAGTSDVYRNFALPVRLEGRRWVRAVELRPGAPGTVHHARIMLDASGGARELDAEDPEPGYDGLMSDHARFPPGHFLGWAPGKTPSVVPDGLAWPLDPGTDLVLQLHLLPGEQPAAVQAAVGLYFADQPAVLTPVTILLNSKSIDIPAGEPEHIVQDRYRLPVAVDLLGIYPHMHYLGKRVEAVATLPDGTEQPLLRIDDWDFNWQDEYRYVEPVHLSAGTVLSVRFTFDNSADNPRNPNSPPVPVRFGAKATDEMAELMLQVLPAGDTEALQRNLVLKRTRDDILGYQALLRADPTDHANHNGLAVRYLDVGQVALAKEHLEQAVELAPDFAEAHYNLGAAFLAEGDATQAVEAYRRAIELRPDYAEAHNNLGGVLASMGAGDDATVHFRLALQFAPRNAGAHYNLANALLSSGGTEEAIMHYRDALTASPDDAEVHNNLARALLDSGDTAGAVTHYQRAIDVDPELAVSLLRLAWIRATSPQAELRSASEALLLAERVTQLVGTNHPEVLDTLAAAYAASGRFDDAVQTARQAADWARATPGFEPLAPVIGERIQLYLMFKAYRTPP